MKRSQVNEKLRRLAQQEKEAIRPDERHRAMTAARIFVFFMLVFPFLR